jgi:cytochrome c biogenesis protein ResB
MVPPELRQTSLRKIDIYKLENMWPLIIALLILTIVICSAKPIWDRLKKSQLTKKQDPNRLEMDQTKTLDTNVEPSSSEISLKEPRFNYKT